MSQIKFRAWQKEFKRMFEVKRLYLEADGKVWINENSLENNNEAYGRSTESVVLMQNTNQKDIDNKEIYEGDIIKDCFNNNWEIIYQDSAFWLKREGYKLVDSPHGWPDNCYPVFRVNHKEFSKVIGNIYENKELLK